MGISLLILAALIALLAAAAASTHPEFPTLIQRTRITLQPGGPGPTDYELLDIVPVASMDGIPRVQQNVRLHTMVHVLLCHHYPFLPRSPPSSAAPMYDPDLVDDHDSSEEKYLEADLITNGNLFVIYNSKSPSTIRILSNPSPATSFIPSHSPYLSSLAISPFISVNKVFSGRKEPSFILMKLEMRRIKTTLDAECPFIPDEYQDPKIEP